MSILFSAAAERNREPILNVLREVLPKSGTVLELASGSGQHVQYLAEHLPYLTWQPSDIKPEAIRSIEARRQESGLININTPLTIDVTQNDWGVEAVDALLNINMIHISPWEATEGLWRCAADLLRCGGPVVLYGPFCMGGVFTAPSNQEFDQWLRAQDEAWGVRDLGDVSAVAEAYGFVRESVTEMPANNHMVVYRHACEPGVHAGYYRQSATVGS